ncbi:hypothetical protein EPN95_01340 [Patescibacteria group bacterium]|nr:MAG: hypothetical protein EPN95_01340 [Patescibacteria group bacterium]
MINENFIYVGAALNLVGSISYIIETIKGKTKPNRVTWFLWALAPMIAFGAMLGEGVSVLGGLMTFMVGFGPLLVLVASFVNKKSVWKITTFDIICGILSLIGVGLWFITRTGTIAIAFSILADALAGLPTLVKAFKEPETESYLVFLLGAISAIITLLATKIWDFAHIGFALYIFIICMAIFILVRFKLGVSIQRILRAK